VTARVEYEEGYADGAAGAGAQERPIYNGDWLPTDDYEQGFLLGSLDRKAMLADNDKGDGTMTTLTESGLAWRRVPVTNVYSDSTAYHLWEAGYRTLGDVLAASEDDIASRVRWVGTKRAKTIRQQALDAAKERAANTPETAAPEIDEAPAGAALSWSQLLMLLAAFSAGVVTGALTIM